MVSHLKEFHLVHQTIVTQNKQKRKKQAIQCDECEITVDANHKLKSHKRSQHPVSEDTSSSSEPSPPRKKLVKNVQVKIVEEALVDMEDIKSMDDNKDVKENYSDVHMVNSQSSSDLLKEASRKDEIIEAQAKKLDEQKTEIDIMTQRVEELYKQRDKKKQKTSVRPEQKPIPDFLTPVQPEHLKDLLGIRMKCNGNPGGDCLSSCTTIHLSYTNDKNERMRVNRKINHHIADHFDEFYVNKIPLPYSETVGVGSNARQVTCSSREELLAFLRSEDSLCTFSNYQELLAICNLLNIKIHIFTYCIGGDSKKWSWRTIFPDPDMTKYSEFSPGTVPDMLLYNCDNVHYDLLVEDNSRLAVMGPITMGEVKELEEKVEKVEKLKGEENDIKDKLVGGEEKREGQWKTVGQKKSNASVHPVKKTSK